ncbi:hypothetical protein VTN00DRAFT_6664 [Thermoascus crustaceus]|uniref:uncharacterized protein n=1 Tax=Thermoascus crustaceus TaxID=5088 RepID=UPI003743DF7E
MVGATAGIGRAMADRLVEAGAKVTAVGRRKERLDEFVRKHGESKASAVPNKNRIAGGDASFPDVNCIFLNAGIQSPYDLTDPAKFNLENFLEEVNVNFSRFVALTNAFLPFMTQKQTPTSFIFTGSNLAIVPAATLPAYSASKAALNAFVLCLREQLRNSNVKVIEISPPPVQTELHDYMGEEAGRKLVMPLNAFAEEAYKGLVSSQDQIVIGAIGPADTFNEIIDKRRIPVRVGSQSEALASAGEQRA